MPLLTQDPQRNAGTHDDWLADLECWCGARGVVVALSACHPADPDWNGAA